MEQECALEGCHELFVKRVHNQRFHSTECCRIYTNKRILEQYHEKRNRKKEGRVCRYKNCDTVLSIYNEDDACALHQRKEHVNKLRKWGWKVEEL